MIRAAARRRDAREAGWPRGATTPPWARWPAPVLLVLTCAVQLATPRTLDLSFLLAAVPPLAALAYGPAATALLGGTVLLLISLPDYDLGHPGESDTATVAFVAVLSVLFAWVRSRRDAQLVTVRTVAEAAQFAVLPPLPDRVGPVRCAGLYRAAQRGTLVGGDLFDVRRGPHGVRALVGDVQGHGLAAVGTVAALLGAFREAVLDQDDLAGVAACLDRRLVVDAEEAGQSRRLVIDPEEEAPGDPAELFATAVLLDFGETARELRFLCFGHPPPLLIRGGTVTELRVAAPGTPLGLGIAGVTPPEQVVVDLEPGDWVLTVTDGVTEARDASGAFYPLAQRLPTVFEAERDDPVAFTDAIWSDLVRFSGGVRDDVALLVFVVGE
ncbi:PP2C family protein-serine/threonine phosphatase [Streptomyces aureocirculatus]|uniref:PP2C family protein-serine/threonine phosphatase n=1 Tax=Streptomyces aureocirculatus TaxID=67275 RepID=UPI0004C806EE|nr:PP2C family protein-serine/threonine phosphatase [Streptomyces aureocirculatus]